MGHTDALPGRVGEPETPSDSDEAAMARGVRVPSAAHGSDIDEGCTKRSDRRRVAVAGQAYVLLLRVRVDPAFPSESVVGGSLREGHPVLEDFGS